MESKKVVTQLVSLCENAENKTKDMKMYLFTCKSHLSTNAIFLSVCAFVYMCVFVFVCMRVYGGSVLL